MSSTDADHGGQESESELTSEEYSERRAELQDQYRFYLMNPDHSPGVNYSLYIQTDEFEYPIMNSNSGGFVTFESRDTSIGDGLEPTEEFLTLVGWGFHEAMCFMPDIYFRDGHFEETVDRVYDGKPREYEVWAAHVLIHHFATGVKVTPELEPLAEWAGLHTKFGVPVLGETVDADDGGV